MCYCRDVECVGVGSIVKDFERLRGLWYICRDRGCGGMVLNGFNIACLCVFCLLCE